jgi:hypothetical protein
VLSTTAPLATYIHTQRCALGRVGLQCALQGGYQSLLTGHLSRHPIFRLTAVRANQCRLGHTNLGRLHATRAAELAKHCDGVRGAYVWCCVALPQACSPPAGEREHKQLPVHVPATACPGFRTLACTCAAHMRVCGTVCVDVPYSAELARCSSTKEQLH